MSIIDTLLGLSLNYKLGIAVFTFTVSAYGVLFYLGRRWRKEFEAKGIAYWSASKESRIQCARVTSSLMIVPLVLGLMIKPFEAGKASDI